MPNVLKGKVKVFGIGSKLLAIPVALFGLFCLVLGLLLTPLGMVSFGLYGVALVAFAFAGYLWTL
ncbi:hypothetical protein COT48_01020 [Candidatus Woesearchaeota archaeon CG08_land_8_20_14_0_20_47_9]|nr:MAG: hypothetical protein AUJ69_01360 [Candidatus Woesearchaeota archaeon CG1_02_47_18]PIO04323.1 MAG: hypothetical protein COT48_01020 [Candidatus Woesearchaeota archaeon CG08_land_8_20_14_0_20_47_9]HII30411.1 hypothetical protein [Candidatus Woesearchaeota archaeon]